MIDPEDDDLEDDLEDGEARIASWDATIADLFGRPDC
jgi:hypothetical protein